MTPILLFNLFENNTMITSRLSDDGGDHFTSMPTRDHHQSPGVPAGEAAESPPRSMLYRSTLNCW